MGADLYINKTYKSNHEKWAEKFEQAVQYRNALPEGSEEREEAQKKVSKYHSKMYEVGYFRDSYNDSNLIWKYDLSWWRDLDGFMKSGNITPAKAKKLLKYLDDNRAIFLDNIKKYPEYGKDGELDQSYFKGKLTSFRFFLLDAIKMNEPIECSV